VNKRIFSYLELAAQTAVGKTDDRRSFFLGAVGIRFDGAIVRSLNSSTDVPNRLAHAEARLAKKLDFGTPEVYTARLTFAGTPGNKGTFALAKPCYSCCKILLSRGVQQVFYSIGPGEYGVINDLAEAMNEIKRIN
jgi:hypothetical protein